MAERIAIPAREGRAVELAAGDHLRVIDPEGGQVADLFAFVAGDLNEHLSAQHTRASRSALFPRVGEAFMTNRRRPILTLAADDSPGVHDLLIAACDPERYTELGVEGYHASCAENLALATAAIGHPVDYAPQPVNVFMNIPVAPGGTLSFEPATTRPGDSITLRAELDCMVAVSACPQDVLSINGGAPTPITLEITR